MDDQETRGKERLSDKAVTGYALFLALKEVALQVTDLRGLLNVRKQVASDEVREVRVTWVDTNPDTPVTNV